MTQAPPTEPGQRRRPGLRRPWRGRPWRAGLAPLRTALGLFTVIPVKAGPGIGRDDAARAVLWLPVVGALLAVPAGGVLLAVQAGGQATPRRLLAAALALGVLALLTGGLHLDGLADTADGLGSRKPAAQALEVMRRSDTGPMGVAALVFTVLVQVTAVAVITPRWLSAAALITAVVTSRVAVLLGSGVPGARSGGFGALIAGTTSRGARWLACGGLLAVIGAAGGAAGGLALALRGLGAVACGLVAATALRRIAFRRLGGMTGDVYGAIIEISTAVVLLVAGLSS